MIMIVRTDELNLDDVTILGGSGEQAGRMYQYLLSFVNNGFEKFLAGPVRKGKCSFNNGSAVEVLTQSATSVRGQHIQQGSAWWCHLPHHSQ